MNESIEAFFAAWSVTDPKARHEAIRSALSPQGAQYADPRTPAPLTDPAAISDYVGMFIDAAPGATVSVMKSDIQHGLIRATIAFRMAGGTEQTGQYFIETDGDGRITRMTGFVGTGAG